MKEDIQKKVIGTWKFLSWEYKDESGNFHEYFGRDSKGSLIFDASGNMSVHVMKGGRNSFKSEGIAEGTQEEMTNAFSTYIAYFGKYYVEEPNALVHTVEGSLFPNWVGGNEIRYATFEGNKLILTTPPVPVKNSEMVFYITWERIG